MNARLVPDNILHKGTSKPHKIDKKITHFAVHVSPSIFGLKKPITPSTLSKMQWAHFLKYQF